MKTYTNSYTITHTRTDTINDHFELFLKCGGMSREKIAAILDSSMKGELSAVGIYFEINDYRVAEVEFSVDWEKHSQMVGIHGDLFDPNRPGWEDGISPEAYIAVQHLMDYAKFEDQPVRSWIRVSPDVRNNEEWHKDVCNRLGYNFHGTPAPWKESPLEQSRSIHYLEEAMITQRQAQK